MIVVVDKKEAKAERFQPSQYVLVASLIVEDVDSYLASNNDAPVFLLHLDFFSLFGGE